MNNLTQGLFDLMMGTMNLKAQAAALTPPSIPLDDAEAAARGEVSWHVGDAGKCGTLLDKEPSAERDLVLAMIAQRILSPGSKLFTTRVFQRSTIG